MVQRVKRRERVRRREAREREYQELLMRRLEHWENRIKELEEKVAAVPTGGGES